MDLERHGAVDRLVTDDDDPPDPAPDAPMSGPTRSRPRHSGATTAQVAPV